MSFDSLDRRFDEFEAEFRATLDRCLRQQYWTFVGVLVAALTFFAVLVAAFGPQTGASIATPVFGASAICTAVIGSRRFR